MSSRRDSRVHLSERQSDTLLEFENFKRKYLLVNKHITKLNSTLSVRVEELNAQVSTLYVENLRLRASEISLASQLKREKEKTRRVMADAEAAVGTVMEHLADMRTSLGILPPRQGPSSPPTKRKPPSCPVQPPREAVRLVRSPADTITQIRESDEEEMNEDDTPTRTINGRRPAASRLPLPKLVPAPQQAIQIPPTPIPHINFTAGVSKRKPGRRNSAFLTVEHQSEVPRAQSPAMGSVRGSRRSSLERENEEREVEVELDIQVGMEPAPQVNHPNGDALQKVDEGADRTELGEPKKVIEWPRKADRKGKARQPFGDLERETEIQSSERDSSEGSKEKEKRHRYGIKDVTNSPRKGPTEFVDEKPTEMAAVSPTVSALTASSSMATQLFEATTPKPSTSTLLSPASTPATDNGSEMGDSNTGRERRTRKSVNYAEPKLNTKMRKPDPPPESLKPRTSGGGTRRRKSIPTPNSVLASDEDGDADVEASGSKMRWTEARRKTVHNTAVNTLDHPSSLGDTGTVTGGDMYGLWGDEGRRHSMAV